MHIFKLQRFFQNGCMYMKYRYIYVCINNMKNFDGKKYKE